MQIRSHVLGFFMVICFQVAASGEAPEKGSLTLGAIYKEFSIASKTDPGTGELLFFYGKLPEGKVQRANQFPAVLSGATKWRIAHGQAWFITSDFVAKKWRIEELYRFSWSDLQKGRIRSGPPDGGNHVATFVQSNEDNPLVYVRLASRLTPLAVQVYYDYFPLAEDVVYLFLLRNINARVITDTDGNKKPVGDLRKANWLFTVARYTGAWGPLPFSPDHKGWTLGKWKELEEIEVGFHEAFHAFVKDSKYFFVTESGKAYMAKPAKGQRKIEAVWSDDQQLIDTVISDVDRGKTFAFGTVSEKAKDKAGKQFFFELNEKPACQYFDSADLSPVKAEEPLRRIAQLAQMLRKQRKNDEK